MNQIQPLNTLLDNTKFTPTSTGLSICGFPTNEEYMDAFDFFSTTEELSKWCIGDLIVHAKANGKDILATISNQTGRSIETLRDYETYSRKIPADKRIEGTSYSHHVKAWGITKNHEAMQEELKLAKANNRSVKDMNKTIRDKTSDHTKTAVPDVIHSKDLIAFTESLNSVVSIKRMLNNNYKNLGQCQRDIFNKDFTDLVALYDDVCIESNDKI